MTPLDENKKKNWEMWQHRHAAVKGLIADLLASVQDDDPRCNTFRYLLGNLQKFGQDQFDFFYYGFHPDPAGIKGPRLKEAKDYPATLAVRATLDQISFDLNACGSVLTQRRMADGESETAQKMARTFDVADRLAYAALKPALSQMNGRRRPTVLTYFQKWGFIRTIPYADVAFIGVPYTTIGEYSAADQLASELGNATDLLAIPHEVGHYVYRHALFAYPAGKIENGRVLTILNRMHLNHEVALLPPLNDWLEEIFADVYGTYVAGPVMARDFQDLLLDNEPEAFEHDDGEHPIPAVRPLIYSEALRVLAEIIGDDGDWLNDMAKEADERWMTHLDETQEKRVKALLMRIRPIVKAMVYLLQQAAPVSLSRMWTPSGTAFDNLYTTFYQHVINDRVGTGGDEIHEPDQNDPIPNYLWTFIRRNRIIDRKTGSKEIEPAVWKLIASMSGWAVHGPEDHADPVGT